MASELSTPSPIVIDLERIKALPEEQQVEELARVQRLQAIIASNPLWSWLPHEGEYGYKVEHGIPLEGNEDKGQKTYMELTRRGVYHGAAVAGNRFGKTEINLVDSAIQTLPYEMIPPWFHEYKVLDPERKEVRMRFGGPDEARWLYQIVLPKLRRLLPKQSLWGGDFAKAWQEKRHILTFADGSTWDFLTYNMDLQAWAGGDLDRVSFDEEPKGRHGEDIHEESVARLADRDGHFRYTLTPVEGIGWLYYVLSDEKQQPRKDDEVYVVVGNIDHNPHVSEQGRKKAIREWERKDPLRAEARRTGRWVHLEGLIFPEFIRSIEEEGGHICADRPPPEGATILAVFDPGIDKDHPFAWHLAFIDPVDKGYEVFHTDRVYDSADFMDGPAHEVAQRYHDALAVYGIPKSRPRRLIDPSARNRQVSSGGRTIQWLLQRLGIITRAGQNDRILSYNEIKHRLKTRHSATQRFLLRIQASCDGDLGDELTKYRWKKPRTRTDNAPTAKPEPIKIEDDLIDTVRYGCMDVRLTDSNPRDDVHEDPTMNGVVRRHIASLVKKGRKKGKTGGVW